MGDRQELAFEWPNRPRVAVGNDVQVGAASKPAFLELVANKAKCERRAVDIEMEIRDLVEQVGNRANVVFVGVRDDHPVNRIGVVGEVGKVGDNRLDTWLGLVGEHLPAIENDHATVRLENGAVSSNVTQSAKEGDAYWFGH